MTFFRSSIHLPSPIKPATKFVSWARAGVYLALLLLLNNCSVFNTDNLNPANWFGDDEVNPPKELVNIEREVELRRQWSVNVGNGQGANYTKITPGIDGDTIYAASENGNVVAVEISSGDVLWRQRLDSTISGGVGAAEGLVMIGTEAAEVVVLDQSTGEVLWTQAVSSEVLSAPQSNGDVVVAQTVDGKLVALDYTSGEQRWIYETTLPALTLRGTSKPVITSTGDVIAGFSNGLLVAVSATDGVYRWEERVAVPEGQYDIDRVIDIDGDLLLDGNRILASSYQGNLMAFDISNGRVVWGREASSYQGLERGFGNLYYCDDRSNITAVRDNSDEVVWENTDLEFREITAPTSVGNFIAVADFEGYIHLLSQIDGRIVGRTEFDGDGVRASLLADGGRLYAFGNSGRLTAFELQ